MKDGEFMEECEHGAGEGGDQLSCSCCLCCALWRVTVVQPLCPHWQPALAVLGEHQEEDTSLSHCCLACCEDQWGLNDALVSPENPRTPKHWIELLH